VHVLHSRNPLLHIRLHCHRQTPLLAPCLLPSSTMTQGGYRMGVFKTTWKDLGRVLPQRTPRCSLSMPTAAILRTLPAPTTTTIFIKKNPEILVITQRFRFPPCHRKTTCMMVLNPQLISSLKMKCVHRDSDGKKGAFAPVSSINDAVALDLILVSQLYTYTPEFYTDESRYTVAELGEPSSVFSY